MGVFEDGATSWELVSSTSSVVPADARNFSPTSQQRFQSSAPNDISYVSDSKEDPKIKMVQQWLASKPFGVSSYSSPIDGKFNFGMSDALRDISSKMKMLFPQESYLLLSAGDKLIFHNIEKAIKLQKSQEPKKIETPDVKKTEDTKSDKEKEEISVSLDVPKGTEINAYRAIFGLSLNDKLDHELISNLQGLEKQISAKLKDNSVSGMIYDPISKKIKTTPEDIAEAIKLIK